MALGYRSHLWFRWPILLFLFFTLTQLQAQAQRSKHANIWYFGDAGLDFNSGSPVPLTNSAMNAFEGTASIADDQGRLLFYSDGTTIWNKQHQVMANGNGLLGHSSSSQSCLIVPSPGKSNIYYVFTTDANGGPNGLRYSTIDISRNGGLGEVVEKNTLLHGATSEMLTAVRHQNKRDVWVISHAFGTSTFSSLLVSSAGISVDNSVPNFMDHYPASTSPVDAIGCMKISPDGKKIAVTHRATNKVYIFGFDKQTGKFLTAHSPGALILEAGNTPHGLEFSPDNTKLYITTEAGTRLIQYDLSSNDAATITASRKEVAQINLATSTRYVGNSLQLGPDGKIYVAKVATNYIGVINNPSASGSAINYVDKGVYLAGKISQMGLPAFIQSYFGYTYDIKYTVNCFGQPSNFYFDAPSWEQPSFMQWDFGDPASGSNNTTTGSSGAAHYFSAPGNYTITFTRHINNTTETYSATVTIKAPPTIELGPERKVCPGTTVTLDATTAGATYLWSNGSTSANISTSTPGSYWVDVTIDNCTTRDGVKISHLPLPAVSFGPDKELCLGDVLELNVFHQGATYRWQDGSTSSIFSVTGPGTYRVEITNTEGCTVADEITIRYNDLPVVNLGPDRDICANTTVTLDATQPGMTYRWQDGSTSPKFTVRTPGTYSVTLTSSKGCNATGSVTIGHLPIPTVNLGRDTTLCTGQTLLLNATFPNSTYKWQDGSTAPTFTVKESGTYWVEVTNELGCTVRDEIWVPYLVRPTIFLGNDTTLCLGDTLIIGKELPGGVQYQWQDGSTEAKYKVTKPGIYKLRAYNQHCEATDEVIIKFKDCIGGLFIPNIITPNGDGLNDVFFIHGLTEDNWDLRIFNRWGKEVYHTSGYKNNWAPPASANTGVYFYHLVHRATGRSYKGSLEVVF